MPTIEFPDALYRKVSQAANEAGFQGVDEFVVGLVRATVEPQDDLPLEFFDAERRAKIEEGLADADAGRVMTVHQYESHAAHRREAWLRENPA